MKILKNSYKIIILAFFVLMNILLQPYVADADPWDLTVPISIMVVGGIWGTATITPTFSMTPTVTVTPTNVISPTVTITATITATHMPNFPHGGYASPNPFMPLNNQKVKLITQSEKPGTQWTVTILDLRGRIVRTTYELEWDGRSNNGHLCEGGVYIYQIEAEGRIVTGKVVLIK